ncbi:retrotransposon protein, putative, ty1-copia subclass [Tanacetum coccineum]
MTQQEWDIHLAGQLFHFWCSDRMTFSGKILYMFADTPYPLSVSLMKKMLKHKLEVEVDGVGNDMTHASHKVLGIAPVAIIDRQLPFEYTITSRSTDVVVMALPVQNINHSAFRSMFEREKLSGTNFNDWLRRLKLVLRVEKKMFVIEQPIPPAPAANSEANVLAEWNALYDAYNEVACLMLGSMTPELHRQFENYSPYDMLQELKSMFEKQAGVERFDLIQTFHACKHEEGKPVGAYVLKMKDYVEQLERLGYVLPQDLSVGLILNGLTSDFTGFVRNYNMHNMGKTIGELHAMLIEYEKGLPKKAETPQGTDKQIYIPKPKNLKPTAKEHPTKDDTYHHCKEVGYWKRNCPVYLAELLKKKNQVGTASSLGNGVRAQVEAIRSFDLVLPNGLCFTDFGISVSKNNVLYFNDIPSNGIYEIDMHDLVPNVNSIYNVSTKRAKHNLDSTYLWHCRLAHISKKRIEKLQQEGLLKSTDDESFDQCVSCLSGKMTRKLFPHHPKRTTDLLRIIHTDVCGPLRHVSRQGAIYFITFMDDYSHYGYVYLLKHKHEVFETFKVFKNEVENQLGKTIKALRSDRGGEYISQEFKDYLKACGIVQQLTPPYTPQHNSVFERRNRTLLDMVRSMMNLTTLLLSFWDYALETATRILNMVPTKKVDKTPYELWYRKVPNLSYLKETMGYYFYFPPENKIVVARYAEFFEKNLITQEVSGRAIDLEEIQDEDTSPFEITSKIPMEVESFEPPQEEVISEFIGLERTHRAPNRLCLNVEAEEHSLGDLNEPTSYKAAMLDSESNKWIDAMNAEIQSSDRQNVDSSSKQSTTAMSATEAEYIAASEAAMEAVWIRKFISGLGIVPTINEPIRMFCDNSAALHFANEPGVQRGARHYHRRYHYVRECIALGEIRFLKVHTDDNLADPFTKALPKGKLTQHARSMGLRLASSFM